MIYGLYLSTAGLQAQQAKQNVIANNIANAQTVGFKRDLAVMRARANAVDEDPHMAAYRLPVVQDQGGGVNALNGGIDLRQGLLTSTGNKTDVALDGPGFFTVQGEQGEKLLTRDGQFLLNSEGILVTATSGRPVLSSTGEPIKLNPQLPVTINGQGQITQGDDTGGGGGGGGAAAMQLGLADVTDSRQLMKLGGNVMRVINPAALTPAPATTMVRQGHVEASGVDPMLEMVNMLEGQRAFDANAKMITFQDNSLQELNTIGRVA